ncbi:hypothetical protein ABI59_04380 [Acidobacteria bacterium Mor1]|nr:hypothetical protein ABI59_04380 [Acidobacteria bacterium Mor1]
MRVALFLIAALFCSVAGAAESWPTGEIIPEVPCTETPEQSYSLYLPSNYDGAREWPTLIVLDPRGQGPAAAELFREAAERLGWIVVSSNNSRSDTVEPLNDAAMRALATDVPNRFAVDSNRVYLAGFSGTARFAWYTARALDGAIAGVIACGAGLPEAGPGDFETSFALFGAAGDTDFNHREMFLLDEGLRATDTPHWIRTFEGRHQWFPPELAADALTWFEILHGRGDPDPALGRRLAEWRNAAERHEAAGRLLVAERYYRMLSRVVAEPAATPLRENHARLDRSAAVAARRESATKAGARQLEYLMGPVSNVARTIRTSETTPAVPRLVQQLRVKSLRAEARKEGAAGLTARRMLSHAYVQLGSYVPTDLWSQGEYLRAAISLDLAAELRPELPLVHVRRAQAYSRAGYVKKSIKALERALELGFDDRAFLEQDAELARVRKDKRFARVLELLTTG